MNRKAEKILTIIGIVLNCIWILFLAILSIYLYFEMVVDSSSHDNRVGFFMIASVFIAFSILYIIALVLSILAFKKIDINEKSAGILLIIAGVLSGVTFLQGILLIIAGILLNVRKRKNLNNESNN